MHDYFGKILYTTLHLNGKSTEGICQGIILGPAPPKSRAEHYSPPIPEQTLTYNNFAIAQPHQIKSHVRKIKLFQNVEKIVIEDVDGVCKLSRILDRIDLEFFPECVQTVKKINRNGYKEKGQIFSKLKTVVITEKAILQSVRKSEDDEDDDIEGGGSDKRMCWMSLGPKLKCENICLTFPTKMEDFVCWDIGFYIIGSLSSCKSMFIHRGYWEHNLYNHQFNDYGDDQDHGNHKTIYHVNFRNCLCDMCIQLSSNSGTIRPGSEDWQSCPFTILSFVGIVLQQLEDQGRHTQLPNYVFRNVPKLIHKDRSWGSVENQIRTEISEKRHKPPGYRVEKTIKVWKSIFENFKDREKNKLEVCPYCGVSD
ncbi:uncharacterized protein L201_001507 [Kwoniella dendrophila CBS 6074]|uniref:CxC2-like cysteine cluster KDZ transposase-associated domain-containing protein n=1 Tax=Kwoniella dendrophila CBS 6074 TaxID=1295534 RepID=A0AAX4JQ15_9TREE